MRTPAQTEASKANAALSTGPKTAEGKAISSLNALKTGATSRALILPGEDPAEYDALVRDVVARYGPVGDEERLLAELVATTMWRYRRLLRVEAEFMAGLQTEGATPEASLAELFLDPAGQAKLRLMLRYLGAAAREWRNAEQQLRRVQKARQTSASCIPFLPLPISKTELSEPEVQPESSTDPEPEDESPEHSQMSRAERRALEHARRKAEKRARQADWALRTFPVPALFGNACDNVQQQHTKAR